ncbi:citrate synthase 2 [Actinoplanes solisilvae]|uniref:citrate synthase 2 n=1 Tax=Actinoplanes solisilvae TaxID=2486853 RepID=UPI001F0B9BB8|nr:citrate synthase 2 [Actinoplanes solisilvae]
MVTVNPGLAGVVAFDTEIAEPDRDGGALRYRGVDIRSLAGVVSFGDVWGLLADGSFESPLLPAGQEQPRVVGGAGGPAARVAGAGGPAARVAGVGEPAVGVAGSAGVGGPAARVAGGDELRLRSGDVRVDVQAAAAALGMRPIIDLSHEEARDDVARASAAMLAVVARSARGDDLPPVPEHRVAEGHDVTSQFMIRWRGEPDPRHVAAIDRYWVCAAEHGMNASTFTARVVASTGADVGACLSAATGALSGPLHGGAPARALGMVAAVEKSGDARSYVKNVLDSGQRLMGFGHAVYRAEDPRARILREAARELGAPRYEVALELEKAALAELRERKPDRVLETNVEFWAAIVLDFAEVPVDMLAAMFTCARTAGWSAHILEQKRLAKIIRPSADYVGPAERTAALLPGWEEAVKRHATAR